MKVKPEAQVEETHTDASLEDLAQLITVNEKFVLVAHENPDGDAIGSVRAMERMLILCGKNVVSYVPFDTIPPEYQFIRPENMVSEIPADIHDRILICLDCGNQHRVTGSDLPEQAQLTVNIDHHADNTKFGALNYVRGDAACTTQILAELFALLPATIDAQCAEALFVGLVTDTGRFQYSNTDASSFELAAQLVAAGAHPHTVFQQVYERRNFCRVKLLARGIELSKQHDGGQVVATYLKRDDFDECLSTDEDAEGIVDVLRGIDGTLVALFVRDLKPGVAFARKGSLRTTNDGIDVSVIARMYGGGGHRQAAGFSTDDDFDSIIAAVRDAVAKQL